MLPCELIHNSFKTRGGGHSFGRNRSSYVGFFTVAAPCASAPAIFRSCSTLSPAGAPRAAIRRRVWSGGPTARRADACARGRGAGFHVVEEFLHVAALRLRVAHVAAVRLAELLLQRLGALRRLHERVAPAVGSGCLSNAAKHFDGAFRTALHAAHEGNRVSKAPRRPATAPREHTAPGSSIQAPCHRMVLLIVKRGGIAPLLACETRVALVVRLRARISSDDPPPAAASPRRVDRGSASVRARAAVVSAVRQRRRAAD